MNKYVFLLFLISLAACSRGQDLRALKERAPSSFAEVYDRNGELIHEERSNHRFNRRSWVPLSELPPQLLREIVLLEDKRFFSHFGVDLLAVASALRDWPQRGASTITMQLVKLLEGKSGSQGLRGKFIQMGKAILLEWSLSKNEILEAYLNLLPLKGEIVGIHAGSRSFFRKHPRGLTLHERVILYGMIPAPIQSETALRDRACRYLRRLSESSCESISMNISPHTDLLQDLAPHFATRALKEGVVNTTIDRSLQEESLRLLKGHLRPLKNQNVRDGAVLVLERVSGEVLAYVGSSGDFSRARHVDHIQALRQAGSTLKPFLFADAIAQRLITASTLLKDEPFTITREGLTYQPENYQKSYTMKEVPARIALGSSLNIPAVRVIDLLAPERFHSLLRALRFRSLRDESYYGHSMALGAVDITLWDLVQAYRTLAEGLPPFDPEVSYIISSILSEKENRHLTFGIQSNLSTDSWAAVKTGTSKDMRDNWCVGFTDSYVIGVWVGNSSGDPMWNVTGVSGAAPVFNQLVSHLHRKKSSAPPRRPQGVAEVNGELYLQGTEPRSKRPILTPLVAKITYPQHGSQFAYDPEIPERSQRIFFELTRGGGQLRLNGRPLSERELSDGFFPEKKGRYKLELWEGNELKDTVSFQVRAGKTKL